MRDLKHLLCLFGLLLAPLAVQAAPSRVVSLDLCMDWALAQHAAPGQIAALSPMYRRYPRPDLDAGLPSHDGSLEGLVGLRPDLVLVGQYSALLLRERLRTLGVRVEVIALPTTLAGISAYERRILALLGQDPARGLPPPAPRTPRRDAPRLLLLGGNGIGTGRDTFEHQLIEQAGWRNYLTQPGHQRLDLEAIVADPPEAVLFAAPAAQALANGFAMHPALRRAIPAEAWLSTDYWRWQCPGAWMWRLTGQLNQWLD